MAGNFLRRWFGGPKAPPPSVDDARAELDRICADRPELLPLARWLRELLPDLVPLQTNTPSLTTEKAQVKLAGGIPLLRGEQITFDRTAFQHRWRRVCEVLEVQQPDGIAVALAEAVKRDRLDPGEMTAAVVAGRPEDVRRRAEALGLDAGLTTTVLRFTLFPLFASLETELGPLREGSGWGHGYCPTCGSWPLLGEFRGLDQGRYLRCGLCAASWEAARLWCPYCGCREHDRLQFLHAEGEESKYRAAVCDACRGYVKMIATLSAIPPLHLLVADAVTVHLDLAAAERGYASPP